MNGASFYDDIQSEYCSILIKLIQYYKASPQNEQAKEVVLENFVSENVDIPNVQLNLEPIYVKVKSLETCEVLVDLTLQLLSESLPMNSINIDRSIAQYESLFSQIIFVLENYSCKLKLIVLKFFTNLIVKYCEIGLDTFYNFFPCIYKDLMCAVEAMTISMNVYYDKGEISNEYIHSYNECMILLLKPTKNCEEMMINICSVILRSESHTIFSKNLKQHCLLISNELDLPKEVIIIKNMDSNQIGPVLKCYSKNILEELQNKSMPEVRESWYYQQVLDVIKTLKSCEEPNIDAFLIPHHLKRCHAALKILADVSLKRQKLTKEPCPLLTSDNVFCIWTSLTKLIQHKKSNLLQDRESIQLVLEITMMTCILFRNNMPKDGSKMILPILCLQTTPNLSEHSLAYQDSIKGLILKYILIIKLVVRDQTSDDWTKIISHLSQSKIMKKSVESYKEVSIP